ncbi:hypothetical protein [Vibrio sp. 10N]|uniref:hypothetical protein n=1 Tax=Vibrio sp. 10N TaxID=3058938 RepID=UPI002813FBD1|nr:hypothetical protein VB10N_46580 [Vibrio sp. 10N]
MRTVSGKSALILFAAIVPFFAQAIEASGCVETTGSLSKDRVIANALAKGNLAHELGSTVTASSNLETKTIESNGSIETVDTLTESVSLKSENYIERVLVTAQGYEQVNGSKHYCVHLRQQESR